MAKALLLFLLLLLTNWEWPWNWLFCREEQDFGSLLSHGKTVMLVSIKKKKSVKASEKITVESHVVQYGLIVKKHSRNNCILKVAKEKVILNGFHAHASIMLIADICGNFLTRRFMSTFKTWCFICPLMLSSEILPFPYIFLMINFRWQLF